MWMPHNPTNVKSTVVHDDISITIILIIENKSSFKFGIDTECHTFHSPNWQFYLVQTTVRLIYKAPRLAEQIKQYA